jgi:hypothetical protein
MMLGLEFDTLNDLPENMSTYEVFLNVLDVLIWTQGGLIYSRVIVFLTGKALFNRLLFISGFI